MSTESTEIQTDAVEREPDVTVYHPTLPDVTQDVRPDAVDAWVKQGWTQENPHAEPAEVDEQAAEQPQAPEPPVGEPARRVRSQSTPADPSGKATPQS